MLQTNSKKRGIGQKIGIAAIILLVILIICTFVVYGMFKDVDAAPSIFGNRIYIMNNDTLGDSVKKGAAVFVKEGLMPDKNGNVILVACPDTEGVPDIQPGQEAAGNKKSKLAIVVYCGSQDVFMPDGTVVTKHMVKYGNAPDDNRWLVDTKDIIGKATSYDTTIGAIIRFVSSRAGMLVMVIVPCALIVIYEVVLLLISIRRKSMEAANDYEDNPSYLEDFGVPDSKDVSLNFGHNSSKPSNKPDVLQQSRNEDSGKASPKASSSQAEKPTVGNLDKTITFTPGKSSQGSQDQQTNSDYWESVRKAQRRPEQETGYQPGLRAALDSTSAASRPNPAVAKPSVSVSQAKPAAQPVVKPAAADTKPVAPTASAPTASLDNRDTSQRIDELMRMLKEETEKLNKK